MFEFERSLITANRTDFAEGLSGNFSGIYGHFDLRQANPLASIPALEEALGETLLRGIVSMQDQVSLNIDFTRLSLDWGDRIVDDHGFWAREIENRHADTTYLGFRIAVGIRLLRSLGFDMDGIEAEQQYLEREVAFYADKPKADANRWRSNFPLTQCDIEHGRFLPSAARICRAADNIGETSLVNVDWLSRKARDEFQLCQVIDAKVEVFNLAADPGAGKWQDKLHQHTNYGLANLDQADAMLTQAESNVRFRERLDDARRAAGLPVFTPI